MKIENGGAGSPQKPENPGQQNLRSLTFIVNGKKIEEQVNLNQSLQVGADKALHDAGSTSKLSDYLVLYENKEISTSNKVEDYHFPASAVIYLNLAGAGGGNGI